MRWREEWQDQAGGAGPDDAVLPELPTLDLDLVDRRTAELLERNTWPRERLLAYQRHRLRTSLQHAVAASAYYKDQIAELGARDAPLEEFPALTKSVLMAQFDRIVMDHRLTRALAERHLSGDRAGALLLDEYRGWPPAGPLESAASSCTTRAHGRSAVANLLRFQRWVGVFPGYPEPRHRRVFTHPPDQSLCRRAARRPTGSPPPGRDDARGRGGCGAKRRTSRRS